MTDQCEVRRVAHLFYFSLGSSFYLRGFIRLLLIMDGLFSPGRTADEIGLQGMAHHCLCSIWLILSNSLARENITSAPTTCLFATGAQVRNRRVAKKGRPQRGSSGQCEAAYNPSATTSYRTRPLLILYMLSPRELFFID